MGEPVAGGLGVGAGGGRERPRQRRWPWIIGGGTGIVVAAAAVLWFLVVPQWRPPLHDGERYGVDVSSHQGEIDWAAVADDHIGFAYIKASEGGDFTDSRFAVNWREAAEAGLERGAYHFFTLCRSGLDQARHFLEVAPPDDRALPPAVDLELAGNCSKRPAPDEVRSQLDTFLATVEAAWGRRVVIYVRGDWEGRYAVRSDLDRPLWHFRFLRRPDVDGWVIWQAQGFAKVDGIDGKVDLNVMRS